VLAALALTHVTIAAVTIYLHRCQAHRALELHPLISHFFRFWLWLTTGMVTKEWAAIHRKHHAKCETEEDPHSPVTRGCICKNRPMCVARTQRSANRCTAATTRLGFPQRRRYIDGRQAQSW